MKPCFKIEEATALDRAFILESLARLQDHEVALHDTRKTASNSLCERYFESIQSQAASHGGALLVAFSGDIRVGFIGFWIEQASAVLETADLNRFGYVSDIYVAEDYRGKGVAKRMLEEAEARVMADGAVKRMRVCTLAFNQLAISAYESAGFEPYEVTYEKVL